MMTNIEVRATFGLAGVYALRMLGMFLILPVFALYAQHLPGVSQKHVMIGIALGSYGLTQAILQLPLGMLSDRIGRKKVIYGGLILFAIGSFIAGGAHDIYILTLGRIIQGAGAISAAITALLADLTREEQRTRAMAVIGMSIGTTFAVSLVLGPLLARYIGVDGIFFLTGVLSIAALLGVRFFIPNPVRSRFHSDAEAKVARLPEILKNKALLPLNYGIFALHATQMALFITIPFSLIQVAHLDKAQHWTVYLPVVIIGFVLMVPAIIYGEKKAKLKTVVIGAIALMMVAQLGMALQMHSLWQILLWLALYFIAFNILEASLPSLISKIAPVDAKGTAIGVYNTAQSLGLFVGAALGGWLYSRYGVLGVFSFTGLLMLSWLIGSFKMTSPEAVRSMMFSIGSKWQQGDMQQLSQRLASVAGVREAIILPEEGMAYLKVASANWDEKAVKQLIQETY